ncbi:MAG: UPF0182 family protein, partial [Nanoarchaeota archaeon]
MRTLKQILGSSALLIIVFLFFSISTIVRLITDYRWFRSLGHGELFTTPLQTKIFLFFVPLLIFLLFSVVNLWIARRSRKLPFGYFIIGIVAFFMGMFLSSQWIVVLQYLNQQPFGLVDPIFGKDVSFYVFSLPFFMVVWGFAFFSVFVTTILVGISYLFKLITSFFNPRTETTAAGTIKVIRPRFKLGRGAEIHLIILVSLLFIIFAIKHYLDRFSILHSEQGIVVGAGYADLVAFLPSINVLMIFALAMPVILAISMLTRKRKLAFAALLIYLVVSVFAPFVIPGIIQTLQVTPNEINLEKPYLEHNLKFTRLAYGLDVVERQAYAADTVLSPEILEEESETLANIRILDWRPLTQTYKQTQEIRLYYDLSGIDIDRYTLNGKYTQVMSAPRELDQSQLAENAKTWVNSHLIYTHGYGIVTSPVNDVTEEGLPKYLIKDIPPVYTNDDESLKITHPQIYYGETKNSYVLVKTKEDEFDYPKGEGNEYTQYLGTGGVVLDGFITKLLMAIRFSDIRLLLNSDITAESRIMFHRNIQERITTLTPFLLLDRDPFLVVADGRLKWIQDAYTVTDKFPYAQKMGGINYMRNAVKVVIDAFDGSVIYYVSDPQDPIVQTYTTIFPNTFLPLSELPPVLLSHLRYPEDLFRVQSEIYNTYHMEDSSVFYNKEDAWQIPKEIYGTGQQVAVDPYYIIMKL